AKVIVNELDGVFPREFDVLVKLPGIGDYTAGAICDFAFGQDIAAIDTNVEQVFGHVYRKVWEDLNRSEKKAFLERHISDGNGAAFHHALMDVGTALKAGESCPFHHESCKGIEVRRRKPIKKVSKNAIAVVAGLLIHEGKVLIARRRLWDSNGGKWEFPGGKVESGEDRRAALKREMMEELGVEVSVRPPFHRLEVEFGGNVYDATFHRCSLLLGDPQPLASEEIDWITADEFEQYDFLEGNKVLFPILREKKGMWRVGYNPRMPNETSELVQELRKQNELLQKIYDLQLRTNKQQKHRDLLDMALKVLPFVIVLILLAYIYWQMTTSINNLTTQVTDIRTNVESTFGLLTNQFSQMNEYFSSLLSNVKTMIPDFGNVPGLIQEQFLSS
ncbi:MAG TPA: NUDIX domain-containing protein, partial [Candidatus Gracilibacteria bacterium]|nr:NUDIX domain-containing protein [Candidatus Gracilibacteria bacterium]